MKSLKLFTLVISPPLSFSHPEATDQGVGVGGRRELKSVPFISYLSALQKSQLLTDDIVNGVEIRCEEKGSCPAGCHLCHHQTVMGGVPARGHTGSGRSGEQPSPIPVLLEVSRVVPLYNLVQDNVTKEVRNPRGERKSVRVRTCVCSQEVCCACVVVLVWTWPWGLTIVQALFGINIASGVNINKYTCRIYFELW